MVEGYVVSFVVFLNFLFFVYVYWDFVVKFVEVFDKFEGIWLGFGDGGLLKLKVEGFLFEWLVLKGLLLLWVCVWIVF